MDTHSRPQIKQQIAQWFDSMISCVCFAGFSWPFKFDNWLLTVNRNYIAIRARPPGREETTTTSPSSLILHDSISSLVCLWLPNPSHHKQRAKRENKEASIIIITLPFDVVLFLALGLAPLEMVERHRSSRVCIEMPIDLSRKEFK